MGEHRIGGGGYLKKVQGDHGTTSVLLLVLFY